MFDLFGMLFGNVDENDDRVPEEIRNEARRRRLSEETTEINLQELHRWSDDSRPSIEALYEDIKVAVQPVLDRYNEEHPDGHLSLKDEATDGIVGLTKLELATWRTTPGCDCEHCEERREAQRIFFQNTSPDAEVGADGHIVNWLEPQAEAPAAAVEAEAEVAAAELTVEPEVEIDDAKLLGMLGTLADLEL